LWLLSRLWFPRYIYWWVSHNIGGGGRRKEWPTAFTVPEQVVCRDSRFYMHRHPQHKLHRTLFRRQQLGALHSSWPKNMICCIDYCAEVVSTQVCCLFLARCSRVRGLPESYLCPEYGRLIGVLCVNAVPIASACHVLQCLFIYTVDVSAYWTQEVGIYFLLGVRTWVRCGEPGV
jgi:hypothetical protein